MVNTKNFQKFASNIAAKNSSFKFANFKKFADVDQNALKNTVTNAWTQGYQDTYDEDNPWLSLNGAATNLGRIGSSLWSSAKTGVGNLFQDSGVSMKDAFKNQYANYTKDVVDSSLKSADKLVDKVSRSAGDKFRQAQEIAQIYRASGKPIPPQVEQLLAEAKVLDDSTSAYWLPSSRDAKGFQKNIQDRANAYQKELQNNMMRSTNTQKRISQELVNKAKTDFNKLDGWEKIKIIFQKLLTSLGIRIPKDWALNAFMQRQRNDAYDYLVKQKRIPQEMMLNSLANSRFDPYNFRSRQRFFNKTTEDFDELNANYSSGTVHPEVANYLNRTIS